MTADEIEALVEDAKAHDDCWPERCGEGCGDSWRALDKYGLSSPATASVYALLLRAAEDVTDSLERLLDAMKETRGEPDRPGPKECRSRIAAARKALEAHTKLGDGG